ncbi:unnamed protein product [Hyaloperonospora brassicae]|uniref:histone acetyltransferase n=1 Tax=Hyaloperonospora brassicae TaxID=162125 RepID=A0AAV0U4H6_HYABA|nr:unnamed protein product [Hyaloperonospora brassicae]
MGSETGDEEVSCVHAASSDDIVSASEGSSQSAEESEKSSQGDSETGELKREENDDIRMEAVATTGQGDVKMNLLGEGRDMEESAMGAQTKENVEMMETEDGAKERAVVIENDEKMSSKDVHKALAVDGDEGTENERSIEGDLVDGSFGGSGKVMEAIMKVKAVDETVREVKSASNGATSSVELVAKTETNRDVASKPASEVTDADTDARQDVPVTSAGGDTVCTGDAGSSQPNNAEVQDLSKTTTTDCEDQDDTLTLETSNDGDRAAALVEPAAKKQKVNETVETARESAIAEAPTAAVDGSSDTSTAAMISRDDMAKMEEDSGRLKFDVITNDGTDEHMIQLTTLKNIFAKQLPKMPKEYIVRLVFDRNHRSMLILKNGTHVIGGICYRPFEKNGFAEIAFCAINASDQVKGYGTRLMNHLKEYVKTKNITHFLTYADNYAIGYFKKQGFTKSVSMARPNWFGYIKDYDGGTLMECTIHTQINYLRITSMIHKQRKAIRDKLQERSCSKRVYSGLTQFAEGRLMDIYMVPGVKEAGWSQAVIRNNRIGTRDQGSLKSQLLQLLKAVFNHRSAWPFHEPVDTTVVVDYLDHIKDPVDLQLISKRIDSGSYISKAAFKADLDQMCENCLIYNTPDTNYYKAALDLREFIQSRIQIRDHK